MPEAAALSVSGVHTRYRERDVLRGVDLRVEAGEIFGLLGPNGAGKTTLIRTICGRVTPRQGVVEIAGQRTGRRALRRVGLVPQEIALYLHLTVRENLGVFARLSGLNRAQARAAIDWALVDLHLAERASQRVEQLSGGWKRRVNIAAAVLHRPALLILDEPTVGVDVDARNALQETIAQLSRTGMGVLLATHDLDQAETLCHRVGFLRSGTIAPEGPPAALIEASFKGRKQIIIELKTPADAAQERILTRIGFSRAGSDAAWTITGRETGGSVADLAAALGRHGISTREVRVREPGLDSLFVLLSRDAPTPRAHAPTAQGATP